MHADECTLKNLCPRNSGELVIRTETSLGGRVVDLFRPQVNKLYSSRLMR